MRTRLNRALINTQIYEYKYISMYMYADVCIFRKRERHTLAQAHTIKVHIKFEGQQTPTPTPPWAKSEEAAHGAARAFWQATIFLSSYSSELIKRITVSPPA